MWAGVPVALFWAHAKLHLEELVGKMPLVERVMPMVGMMHFLGALVEIPEV